MRVMENYFQYCVYSSENNDWKEIPKTSQLWWPHNIWLGNRLVALSLWIDDYCFHVPTKPTTKSISNIEVNNRPINFLPHTKHQTDKQDNRSKLIKNQYLIKIY